ncbi:MAG: glycosyltransferase family 2 protein [Gaiellaceae bacterium]
MERSSVSEVIAGQPRAVDARLAKLKRLAIVPALNEEGAIGRVIEEIRTVDPDFDIVVVDDGSTDRTAAVASARGVRVLSLPFNLGIGGAVQTGFLYAWENHFDIAVQIDGDGQHDPRELGKLLVPILDGTADMAVGTRFSGEGSHGVALARRLGIHLFARTVSLIVRQKVTDTTSGFRAVNRRGICLFAVDYPHDYPEVEATVLVFRHRLRMVEVPVAMRTRESGSSSITAARSLYYMFKVSLALLIGLFRRRVTPLEEK